MRKEKTKTALSMRQVESMRSVAEGADVLAYGIAMDLREVQKLHPEFISIGRRQYRYSVTEKLPYFGAILTEAGRHAIADRVDRDGHASAIAQAGVSR